MRRPVTTASPLKALHIFRIQEIPQNDALTTDLQDHLAGALHAIELPKAMRDHHAIWPVCRAAPRPDRGDRNVLAGLIERTGTSPGGMKEWGTWLAEKVSRLKLKHGSAG